MWTILIIALVQMPGLALTPAINLIQTQAFPEHSLADVQIAMGFTNLASPLAAVLAWLLIYSGRLTKKAATVLGLCFLFATGMFTILFHSSFWNLYVVSILLGLATGFYMTNAFGLLFDNFDNDARQVISGYQTSAINAGGILLSLLGGFLATRLWFGGYLLFLIGLLMAIMAVLTVPSREKTTGHTGGSVPARSKLNARIFYYAAIACIFMMLYVATGSNLSTHLSKIGGSATAGIASAIQMGGGVVAGIFFGKLSSRLKDMVMVLACGLIFIGFMLLSLFSTVLAVDFIAVFIAGMSLSLMLPHCTYRVSTLVDTTTSATATLIASSIAPSLEAFCHRLSSQNSRPCVWKFHRHPLRVRRRYSAAVRPCALFDDSRPGKTQFGGVSRLTGIRHPAVITGLFAPPRTARRLEIIDEIILRVLFYRPFSFEKKTIRIEKNEHTVNIKRKAQWQRAALRSNPTCPGSTDSGLWPFLPSSGITWGCRSCPAAFWALPCFLCFPAT
jgi:MFS family permease